MPSAPTTTSAPRLRWLDALRGIAVIAVVYEHFVGYIAPGLKIESTGVMHAGTFGVMLFFLVSGYIVPASIERRGSVRNFWIGRLFRLYPAFLLTIAIVITIEALGRGWVPDGYAEQPSTTLLAHATMLHEVLGADNMQHQFWTLTYEMVFYLLVTIVFVCGVHRFSAEIAVLLAGAAFVLGGIIPARGLAADGLAALTAVVLFLGIVMVSGRRRAIVVGGAVLLGALVLGLLGGNQRDAPWEGLIILAVMFTGTALYRFHSGQIGPGRAFGAVGVVVLCAIGAAYLHGSMWHMLYQDRYDAPRSWVTALVLAFAVFGAGMLLRERRVPGWLSWLGAISYSVYLLHYVFIYLGGEELRSVVGASIPVKVAVGIAYLAVTLGASWGVYRLVELPFQRLGRRVVSRSRLVHSGKLSTGGA